MYDSSSYTDFVSLVLVIAHRHGCAGEVGVQSHIKHKHVDVNSCSHTDLKSAELK